MKHLLTIYYLGFLFLHLVYGHPEFADQIPNGKNVPNPCEPYDLWVGVGHLNKTGGGGRNVFGLDFARAKYQWTEELCKTDSDNDGRANGVELGDPFCQWKYGKVPSYTTGITHPGIREGECQPK